MDVGERVKQFYTDYLDSLYSIRLYRAALGRINRRGHNIDFVVALSAALAGASGTAGSLLKDPILALPCGIISLLAVILAAAKGAFHLQRRADFYTSKMIRYNTICVKCTSLFKDLQANKQWLPAFEKRYNDIQHLIESLEPDPYPELSLGARQTIQKEVIESEVPQQWWRP